MDDAVQRLYMVLYILGLPLFEIVRVLVSQILRRFIVERLICISDSELSSFKSFNFIIFDSLRLSKHHLSRLSSR